MWFVTRFGGGYVCDAFVVWALSVRVSLFSSSKSWMVELFYFLFGGCTAPLNVAHPALLLLQRGLQFYAHISTFAAFLFG
jgi:hypothetical protein